MGRPWGRQVGSGGTRGDPENSLDGFGLFEHILGPLEASWSHVGPLSPSPEGRPSWGRRFINFELSLNRSMYFLEAVWTHSERLLGLVGSFLEPSWGAPGGSLGFLGAPLGNLEAAWGLLQRSWDPMGAFWSARRPSEAILGPSWSVLGSSWRRLGGAFKPS